MATLLFYDLNDVVIQGDHDRAYRLIMRVAEGELVDVQPLAAELRQWA